MAFLYGALQIIATSQKQTMLPEVGPKGTPVLPIQWLHIPKTGTTFANTIYRHSCQHIPDNATLEADVSPIRSLTDPYPPEVYCQGGFVAASRLGGHYPAAHQDRGRLVSIFRQPLDHKISQLRYAWQNSVNSVNITGIDSGFLRFFGSQLEADGGKNHDIAMLLHDGWRFAAAFGPPSAHSSRTPQARRARCSTMELTLSRMRGCQSKMSLFNEGCLSFAAGAEESRSLTADTRSTVVDEFPQAFSFAGVKERWDESVCLFRLLMRSSPASPVAVEFYNTRPTQVRLRRARSSTPTPPHLTPPNHSIPPHPTPPPNLAACAISHLAALLPKPPPPSTHTHAHSHTHTRTHISTHTNISSPPPSFRMVRRHPTGRRRPGTGAHAISCYPRTHHTSHTIPY